MNARTLQSGQLVEHEKALPLFKKLNGISAEELVYFYDELQKTTSAYLLPFMPFGAICIKLGFAGLCRDRKKLGQLSELGGVQGFL